MDRVTFSRPARPAGERDDEGETSEDLSMFKHE
jgi:hypothetical protein